MKPKPFASLNHLTIPVAIPTSPVTQSLLTTSTLEKLNDRHTQPFPPHKLTSASSQIVKDELKKVPA
ncbi:hypothetical protein X962_5177 [Burkholderia pseudomallei MSHR7343]|nr:hypothetical protein DO70_2379 [Burkholderia pseudomallei]KGD57011.1 hypothetical protein DP49_3805 [Burkholderia pseudomallei]KGS22914.1 hypothetical protein X962_5177 [Burkholderia pseudomallei MSHR7343]KGX71011.1 hypothetical protein Y026_3177 [Burkholderia pseudomallei TSV28]